MIRRARSIVLVLLGMSMVGSAGIGYSVASAEALPTSAERVQPLGVGETAPDAAVRTVDGESFRLGSLIGRKALVLIFYRGGW